MTVFSGALRPVGRIAILVSRYHERVTTRLLDGARDCCHAAGIRDDDVDIIHVAGAFELGVVASALAASGRYACLVALGAVIRGETPHFDYVAGETARVLAEVASREIVPVGFGLLTTDTLDQAMERAGGSAGNKGYEAAEAAILAADVLGRLHGDDA